MVANSIQNLPALVDSGQHSIVTAPADTGPSPRMRNLTLRGSGSTSLLPSPFVALSCRGSSTLIIAFPLTGNAPASRLGCGKIVEILRGAGQVAAGCRGKPCDLPRRVRRWVVAADREDGGRFIVRADEILTAFSGTGMGDSGFTVTNEAPVSDGAVE